MIPTYWPGICLMAGESSITPSTRRLNVTSPLVWSARIGSSGRREACSRKALVIVATSGMASRRSLAADIQAALAGLSGDSIAEMPLPEAASTTSLTVIRLSGVPTGKPNSFSIHSARSADARLSRPRSCARRSSSRTLARPVSRVISSITIRRVASGASDASPAMRCTSGSGSSRTPPRSQKPYGT